jgi:DNA-binding NarL/FixJ family response regulator
MIVMSGQPEVRRAALAAGADAFISKTDPPDQLLAALKELCPDPNHENYPLTF